ncbi:hypothetical protein P8452_20130 [Trifolium repens]|nr:hypothetical protein P8452_20130 [Trifolium repens]
MFLVITKGSGSTPVISPIPCGITSDCFNKACHRPLIRKLTYCGGSRIESDDPVFAPFHCYSNGDCINKACHRPLKRSQVAEHMPIENEIPCHWDEDCEVHLPCELPLVSKCINHNCECV